MADRFLLRRVWFQAHLWLGIALFLVLAPLSAAGSMLVWHDALDEAVNPQRFAVSGPAKLSLDTYAASARGVLGRGQDVASIRMPERGDGPVVVSAPMPKGAKVRRGRPPSFNVWIDPGTGKVLDTGRSDGGLVRWLHVFHGSLQMPGVGRKVVGWLGWAMTVSALTGIWLWWPRGHKVLTGLRWRRALLVSSNLHHMVGFWVSIPLAVLAFSGAWISFPQTARVVVAAVSGAPAPQPKGGQGGSGGGGRPLAQTRLTPDQAVEVARHQTLDGSISSVTWPTTKKPEWSVRLGPPSAPGTTYSVNDVTRGVKVEGARPDAASGTARLMRLLHDGSEAGPVWQIIIFVAGWAPAALGFTGLLMWIRNRGPRKARNSWRQNGGRPRRAERDHIC